MKKRLLVTDTHLGLYSDSDLWLDIVLSFYKHIVSYTIKNKISEIIHLGDFFDNRKSLNTKTQHIAHRIAKILKLNKNLHTYIIVGNHDCYYKNKIHPNTLELFKEYDHITIIDEIFKLDDILLVPWGEIPNDTQDAKYCFGHFAINGFHMNDSYKCKTGIDKVRFKDFDKVLSGHFHTPSSNNNIVYLGAPYGQTFHDAGGVRGFHIFEDGKLDFIEYKKAPKFIKIHTEGEFSKEDVENNIIKIIFNKDYGTNKNQEIIDNIISLNPLLYSINFTNIESEDVEDFDDNVIIDSKEEIINQYIESQQFPSNINILNLKSMFRSIMKEANEIKTKIQNSGSNKIECISVGFQNFLSYGSQWQEIPLNNGINFVFGFDEDRGKSNGAGKSSFLETIPFALFGKTARDIRQDQIINWKNKKNCQVVFKFKINEDVYEINRQLKPNNLEIYKNGSLIDQDAHKTDYQNMFENIFGMDVKMFMSLIHSNINSSANILNMKKNEKRAFIEKMFGLEIYSHMNKICNDKLRDVDQKKYKIDTDITSSDDKIKSYEELNVKFKNEIDGKKSSLVDVDVIKTQLDKLKEDNPDINNKIKSINDDIDKKENEFSSIKLKHEKFLSSQNTKIDQLNKEIKSIDNLEDQKRKNEDIKIKIKEITDKIGDIDSINKKIEEKEKNLNDVNDTIKKKFKEENELSKEVTEARTNLKNMEESFRLFSEGKCPTCGQDVKDPISHYKNDSSSLRKIIDKKQKEISSINKQVEELNSNILKYTKDIKILHSTKDKINDLRNDIKEISDLKSKDDLLKDRKKLEDDKNNNIDEFTKKQQKYDEEISELKNNVNELNIEYKKIQDKEREYEIILSKSKEVKKHIKSLKLMIKDNDVKIKSVKDSIVELKEKIKKLNTIADYINTIKIILKDENIKQFTIKKIMPFMNKQTNSYLSEVNYGFYVKIDKWLDVEIKGPGIRNASYGSLSGGERRGIDIAMQLSLIDIAQVQSGLFPDLLVFDELLDSSIDGIGMDQILKIIKTKQREANSKVFIISHRPEIDAELIDHQYRVVKSNGFSKVYI